MSEASIITDRPRVSLADGRAGAAASGDRARLAAVWVRIESWLTRLGDRCNPILVKETRQALRSWHFTLTFLLLLVAGWVVTMGGIALVGPSIYYVAGGGELLRGYYLILSLPVLVVVPFAAFRSLAAEREENTYDLVSITTLRPTQIIGGKLASAMLQMAMYFSAITPCLAFTYLLRGVDAPSIALLLVYTFLASVALSTLGLLLAALPIQRYGQLVLSIGFVALLLLVFQQAQEVVGELVNSGFEWYTQRNFWAANLFGAMCYATTLLLVYLAAAAMITFSSENRSTPLRIAVMVQQSVLVGWGAWLWLRHDCLPEYALSLLAAGGCYWLALGALLNSEHVEVSRRALRHLPQSALGRTFLTWLSPGPASGYMFAVANLTTIALLALVAGAVPVSGGVTSQRWIELASVVLLVWGYAVAYLGVGRLIVDMLRRFIEVTMFAGVLLHVLLVLAGCGIPTIIEESSLPLQNKPYSYVELTNPVATLSYVQEFQPAPELPVLLIVIPAAAICALLWNLPGAIRELGRARTALPARVVADEAELHPPPPPQPQSPWDAEE